MTGIQWTDETWNPVTGCEKVSAGCKNCYAERLAPRVFAGQMTVGRTEGDRRPRRFTDVRCHDDRLDQPLRWRKPRRVFVNSMSDLFHEDLPDEFIDRVFAVMALSPKHTFQVLTKRPKRMAEFVRSRSTEAVFLSADEESATGCSQPSGKLSFSAHAYLEGQRNGSMLQLPIWPLPNVWLGVSVEDQATADERIPILLDTPAAVRLVSCEPLLGRVNLGRWLAACPNSRHVNGWQHGLRFDGDDPYTVCVWCNETRDAINGRVIGASRTVPSDIDWVIVGGESGPKARPCDVDWIRSIVGQCRAAGVACCVKQLGARSIVYRGEADGLDAALIEWDDSGEMISARLLFSDRKGGDPAEWPEDLRIREFPAGTGGVLFGR